MGLLITHAVGEQSFAAWVNNTTALIVGGVNNFPHVSCDRAHNMRAVRLDPISTFAIILLILISLLPTMGSSIPQPATGPAIAPTASG